MKHFFRVTLSIVFIISAAGALSALDSFELPARDLRDITEIHFHVPGKLEFTQGPEMSFRMEGPQRLLDKILVETGKDTLNIKARPMSMITVSSLRVYVTLPEISFIATSSSGNINSGTINSMDLTVKTSSSGDIKLDSVQAVKLALLTSSSGNISIGSAMAEETEIKISSSGDVRLQGSSTELQAVLSSSGDLSAQDFRTETADIRISSSGDANIWVTGDLEVRLSSSGNVSVWGTPVLTDMRITSSGEIIGKGAK